MTSLFTATNQGIATVIKELLSQRSHARQERGRTTWFYPQFPPSGDGSYPVGQVGAVQPDSLQPMFPDTDSGVVPSAKHSENDGQGQQDCTTQADQHPAVWH